MGLVLLVCTWFAVGCPLDDDDDPPADDDAADDDADDDDDTMDDDGGDDDSLPCGFGDPPAATIEIQEKWDISSWKAEIAAFIGDRPAPYEQQLVQQEGDCRYLRLWGVCDPPCESPDYCAGSGECVAPVQLISGGTLTIDGLPVPVVIEPSDWNPGYYGYYGPPSLPDNLFDAGALITAHLEGDAFPSVALSARGVAPIDTAIEMEGLPLMLDQDTVVTWTPAEDEEACVVLRVAGPVSSHGLPTNHVIWCETRDIGELTVPSSLVNAFIEGGGTINGECYQTTFSRQSRDLVQTDIGPAELLVRSVVISESFCIGAKEAE